MLIGDILAARGLIGTEDIENAVQHQKVHGGRIGDCLIAIGAITPEQLDGVLSEAPASPKDISATEISANNLLQLIIKSMYAANLESPSQIAEMTKLPFNIVSIVLKTAEERKFISALGSGDGGSLSQMRYGLSELGRKWAAEAMVQSQYIGPAPVSLNALRERVDMQRISNERISRDDILNSFDDLTVPDDFIRRLGPAINSGRSILIYGPAGNGKTTVAEKIGDIFQNIVYIPHCFEVDGQIIKVFDPAIHVPVKRTKTDDTKKSLRTSLRREEFDHRWVPCYRPVVITGGELTLEMLDLKFNSIAKFYEAPLHVKALSGTFIIDDFGRQMVSPEDLLNRWIVPLQSRKDYLKLHTGSSFMVPFDELVIFSTNMAPESLMDPAFLRRIPYKLETMEPDLKDFRNVFHNVSKSRGLELTEETLDFILNELTVKNNCPLAYYQPVFIVDQVLSACKYEGIAPAYSEDFILFALNNLYTRGAREQMKQTE